MHLQIGYNNVASDIYQEQKLLERLPSNEALCCAHIALCNTLLTRLEMIRNVISGGVEKFPGKSEHMFNKDFSEIEQQVKKVQDMQSRLRIKMQRLQREARMLERSERRVDLVKRGQ